MSTRRALRRQSDTWAFIGHLGNWILEGHFGTRVLTALRHSSIQGPITQEGIIGRNRNIAC